MTAPAISNADPRWVWNLNWTDITPRIVIGSCPMAGEDLARICSGARVSAVLSLQHDECHARFGIDYGALCRHGAHLGLALLRHPIRDFDAADARLRLPEAVRALDGLLAAHDRVYVHCTAGIGRSPLAVLGHLVFVQGMLFEDALALLRACRPGVCPNLEAFLGCRADLAARHSGAIAQRVRDLETKEPGANPEWRDRRAEHEVLREVLRGGRSAANPPAGTY